jgi:apolipoprotein N-acyltransferase
MLKEFKDKHKSFRNAFVFNFITVAVIVISSVWLIISAFSSGDTFRDILTLTAVLIAFNLVTAYILYNFMKNHKFAKIYFMLLLVFGLYIATWFKLTGFLIVVFLVIALFVNISAYRKMHPKE